MGWEICSTRWPAGWEIRGSIYPRFTQWLSETGDQRSVSAFLGGSVRREIRGSVSAFLGGSVRREIRGSVSAFLGGLVGREIRGPIPSCLGGLLGWEIEGSVPALLGGSVGWEIRFPRWPIGTGDPTIYLSPLYSVAQWDGRSAFLGGLLGREIRRSIYPRFTRWLSGMGDPLSSVAYWDGRSDDLSIPALLGGSVGWEISFHWWPSGMGHPRIYLSQISSVA